MASTVPGLYSLPALTVSLGLDSLPWPRQSPLASTVSRPWESPRCDSHPVSKVPWPWQSLGLDSLPALTVAWPRQSPGLDSPLALTVTCLSLWLLQAVYGFRDVTSLKWLISSLHSFQASGFSSEQTNSWTGFDQIQLRLNEVLTLGKRSVKRCATFLPVPWLVYLLHGNILDQMWISCSSDERFRQFQYSTRIWTRTNIESKASVPTVVDSGTWILIRKISWFRQTVAEFMLTMKFFFCWSCSCICNYLFQLLFKANMMLRAKLLSMCILLFVII